MPEQPVLRPSDRRVAATAWPDLSWTTVQPPTTTPPPAAMVASRWARLGGAIIDSLVVAVPLFVLFGVVAAAGWVDEDAGTGLLPAVSVYGLVALALFAVYNVALLSRSGEHNGQTLGKQLTGTRVVGRDGGPIAVRTATVREVGRALLGLATPLAVADALTVYLPFDRRTLHDAAGGTLVVSAGWFPRGPVATPQDVSQRSPVATPQDVSRLPPPVGASHPSLPPPSSEGPA